MAIAQTYKATIEHKEGTHSTHSASHFTLNRCPPRFSESQRGDCGQHRGNCEDHRRTRKNHRRNREAHRRNSEQHGRNKMFVACYFHHLYCGHRNLPAGNQVEQDIIKWFSPPDPSTNHNTACEIYNNVPPTWFFRAQIFKDWMSNGSLLWVHGKRAFLIIFCASTPKCHVSLLTQRARGRAYFGMLFPNRYHRSPNTHCGHKFCCHTIHYEITRRWKRYAGLFLLRLSR